MEERVLETGPALMAAAKYIGHFCEDINVAFIQCKADNDNPALCVEQGKQVSICAQKVFDKLNTHCKDTFNAYAHCLDDHSMEFYRCRKEGSSWIFKKPSQRRTDYQRPFDECVLNNIIKKEDTAKKEDN